MTTQYIVVSIAGHLLGPEKTTNANVGQKQVKLWEAEAQNTPRGWKLLEASRDGAEFIIPYRTHAELSTSIRDWIYTMDIEYSNFAALELTLTPALDRTGRTSSNSSIFAGSGLELLRTIRFWNSHARTEAKQLPRIDVHEYQVPLMRLGA